MDVANTTRAAHSLSVVELLAKVQTPVTQVKRNNATTVSIVDNALHQNT